MKMKVTVIATIVVLTAIVAVAAFLNRDNMLEKTSLQENAQIILESNGVKVKTIDMSYLKNLKETEFEANLKTNGKAAVKHKYTGILLKSILSECKLKLDENSQLVVTSLDGYASALTGKEVLEDDNVYLTYKMDGASLGTKEDGGKGPYMIVIRKDQFSQRWSKFVSEIDVK